MIEVNRIAKSFERRFLWSDLTFTVEQGEILALVGPSGSGKSTLLNCLGLLERVSSGEIFINGMDITKISERAGRRLRRDTLGYLFQNYALIENANIISNLKVALNANRGRHRESLDKALQAVGLGGRGKEMVYKLSGGEQQRLALARILIKKPSIVLADEPTGSLDDDNTALVLAHLRQMAKSGCAVVIATHSADVESSCDLSLRLHVDGVAQLSRTVQVRS